MPAQRLLAIVCIATFWLTGRLAGEFYPFSPLGMFATVDTVASRLFVRDAEGVAREVGRYDDWRCERALVFESPDPSCPDHGFSAYDEIVLDHIQSHPAPAGSAEGDPIDLMRRVFEVPDITGPVRITDCFIMRCTARPRRVSFWTPRL